MSELVDPPSIYHETSIYQPPRPRVSVSDVERLAKAGVTIPWEAVREQVCRDEDFPAPMQGKPRELEDTFWDRYNIAHHLAREFHTRYFRIACHQHGDKMAVVVMPWQHNEASFNNSGEPPFIIEDEACLYPSDALMAKVALWERNRGKT
ncbi:MAG TPA: hypothetical protein VGU68_19455 [Ktedonobacteraceae bacterium]|nr:hypothetical protein [Ktedonobacteraceae bacterium]